MRSFLRRVGTGLLFLAVAICFAPSLIPPFLDRIYYDGPQSRHYDGARFLNPGFAGYRGGDPRLFFNRWATGEGRAEWPDQVAVVPSVPPRRVDGNAMRVTWVGHATVLVQTQGLNILTDPIWSDRASPFSFIGPKRVRAPGIRFDDLPKIDLILISHNHYDHMDLPSLQRLWARDRPMIVTSLGNDRILAAAGIQSLALDWKQSIRVGAARIVAERNHHWSSRWGADRNRALWSAFTIELPGGNIFFAGDTGWGDGEWPREASSGPIRLAILPIGAYEPRDFMKANHVDPREAVRIFDRLGATTGLGIHWGTFQLTFEPIDEPRQRLDALMKKRAPSAGRFITTEAGQAFDVPLIPAG